MRRADPAPELSGAVKEYWEVEGALLPFRETILPHGWIELMINLGPPHRITDGKSAGMWRYGWLSGLHEGVIRIESRKGTHLVAARLSPIGAIDLLGRSVASAANSVVDLRKFFGRKDGSTLVESVREAPDPSARFAAVENFLRSQRHHEGVPEFVRAAAGFIEKTHGNLRVSSLHEELGVSRKHLTVTFKRVIGVTPRAYAKLHRFTWTITKLQSPESIDWSRLALESGYSDQSHLVRDFRRIGGDAAVKFLARLTPDGIALWEDSR
jgi:AraC-like DNA-binding protein